MLLKPYNYLKHLLFDIKGVKIIDWFNDQYSGIIHAEPAIFIEFHKPFRFETLQKTVQQSEFAVRIHLASKAIQKQDKTINESILDTHFAICEEIYHKIQSQRMQEGDMLIFNSLMRTAYEHHQYMRGWMVTTQDFEGMIYQQAKDERIEKRPNIAIFNEIR